MKIASIVAATALLALAACAHQAVPKPFDLSVFPSCDGVQDPSSVMSGCVLTQEGMDHALLASSAEGRTDVQVVADANAGQHIQVPSIAPSFMPRLSDLNGDARPDLLIPLETGNVNTVYAVYLAGPDATYAGVGQISGVTWEPSATGLLAVSARSSAAAWDVSFYDVEPGGLTPVAIVTVEAQQSDPGARIETVCVLAASPAIAPLGLNEQQAQAQFCADPIVAGMFN